MIQQEKVDLESLTIQVQKKSSASVLWVVLQEDMRTSVM